MASHCVLTHCGRPTIRGRRLCSGHQTLRSRGYADWATRTISPRPHLKGAVCFVPGCGVRAKQRGKKGPLCHGHASVERYRVMRGCEPLDPRAPYERKKNEHRAMCAAPGCDRLTHAKGLCQAHYRRKDGGSRLSIPVGEVKRAPQNKVRTDARRAADERMERLVLDQRRAEAMRPLRIRDYAWDRPGAWSGW